MVVYYKGIAIIEYDVYRILDDSYRDMIKFTQPIKSPEYKTIIGMKSELGDEDEWGEENSQYLAVASAADFVGASLVGLKGDETEVEGKSLVARNIKGEARDVHIEGEEDLCPEFVKDTIRGLEKRLKEIVDVKRKKKLQELIDKMKKEYKCP